MTQSVREMVYNVRREFLRVGLQPPDVILLRDDEQGRRLTSMLVSELRDQLVPNPRDVQPVVVEHPDGSAWMECRVMDVKVRWLARRYALPSGGYRWA